MTGVSRNRILFVTATDTGVGKTLLTGLLLDYLRTRGCRALAMKPFCSGGRGDVCFLQSLQPGEISDDEMNPWSFRQPIAPLAAARMAGVRVGLGEVGKRIEAVASRCDRLIIEGAGGLLAPLGEGFSALDLIERLPCDVVVVARNQLGVINHALLTWRVLLACNRKCARPRKAGGKGSRDHGTFHVQLVLMNAPPRDASARSNPRILAELARPARVTEIPFLGPGPARPGAWKENTKKVEKTLASILG